MYNRIWSRKELTSQRLGTFCEYYAKMSLSSYGISVYTSVVDDQGVDFIAQIKGNFLKMQVKAVRQGTDYVFVRKKYFDNQDAYMYMVLMLLTDGYEPDIYLIPSSAWKKPEDKVFVDRDYDGRKSQPEYGINLSPKNRYRLEPYRLETMLNMMME